MTFISQWKTDNTGGISANNQITLPLESSGTYNFTVNWGDNSSDVITTWNQPATTHTYATPGTYTVSITGTIIGFRFGNTGDKTKIISISQWGDLRVGNNGGYFHGCNNLNSTAIDSLNLTGTTNLSTMFADTGNFNGAINNWDVSNVTNMNSMFVLAFGFNQPLNNWNVSNVTNMGNMFLQAFSFNQPLNSWNVGNVIDMSGMFAYAFSFNQPLNNWDVSNVTNMLYMFLVASDFNQPLNNWNVSKVTNMTGMFLGASKFNQSLNNWRVGTVSDMTSMFQGATSFNQDLSRWCVSLIPSAPTSFDLDTPSWMGGASTRPRWGTCPPRNIPGSVTISGNAVRGNTLTATVTDADGLSGVSISYQWQLSNDSITWEDITGATSSTLTLNTVLVGKIIRVTASYTDDSGSSENIISNPTIPIERSERSTIVIIGDTYVGTTLTTVIEQAVEVNNPSYQWVAGTAEDGWTTIYEAGSSSLTLTRGLINKRIKVLVDYTDENNNNQSIISLPTLPVVSTHSGVVTIAGNTAVNSTLTATVTDDDGLGTGEILYRWQSSNDGNTWDNIAGASSSVLLILSTVLNKRLRAIAVYTTSLGSVREVASDPTGIVIESNAPTDNIMGRESRSPLILNNTDRYLYTIRQLINTTVVNIASHPLIRDPIVYYPIYNNETEREKVYIQNYKTYDGIELIEPGLTLAVFPCYSSKTFNTGFRSSLFSSAKLKPYTLGARSDGFLYEATYFIAVALYYQDVALNNSIPVTFHKQEDRVILDDLDIDAEPRDIIWNSGQGVPSTDTLQLEINPAEDILRDYLDVLRIVLDDIPRLFPFSLRYSQVDSFDFPTTSWIQDEKNIYFHMAYLIWEVGGYLPSTVRTQDPYYPVNDINIIT